VMHARNGERSDWRLARRAIFAVCAAVASERLAAGLSVPTIREKRADVI